MVQTKYPLKPSILLFLSLVLGTLFPAQFILAQAPTPAELESFYVGTLHLGYAAVRASCQPPDRRIPTNIQMMIVEDIQTARKGAEALRACVRYDLSKFDVFTTRIPNRAGDVLQAVERLYQDYQSAVRASSCNCASNGPAQFESFYVGSLSMGFATARPTCFVPTWNSPLPGNVTALIRRDLDTARAGIETFRSCWPGGAAVVAQIDPIQKNLGAVSGKQSYDNLVTLQQKIQSSLRNSTPASPARPVGNSPSTPARTATRREPPRRSYTCLDCAREKCGKACEGEMLILCVAPAGPCQQCMERNCKGLQ